MKILDNKTILFGADYNPDQWLDRPDILAQDIELMKKAHVNCASVGIFSWAKLEQEEGRYDFDWLGDIIDSLWKNDIHTILATPSGARPIWMSHKYPEVLRVGPNLVRNRTGGRHNHCYTSPVYRQKVHDIDIRLAQRFGNHPGVILWHLSNEYGGECYCPLCQEAFRDWLKEKYGSLDALNKAWWTTFWSHTYSEWGQIEAPVPHGEMGVHGLSLDWKRFVTDQTVSFCAMEKTAVREGGSSIPVTTNMMGVYKELNYFKFKDVLDVVSLDSYPMWHSAEYDIMTNALHAAFAHDLMRSIKNQAFLLMESTPSHVNWAPVCKPKKPGVNYLTGLQALAHGANSVQYFQWRKSRGSCEKFHGAVVGHDGRDDTRVFIEVAELGEALSKLGEVAGSNANTKVAILFDWENFWALEVIEGPKKDMRYFETVLGHYSAFWQLGVSVDIVDMECDLGKYSLVVAPMLYMQRAGIAEKLQNHVKKGGTLVGSAFSAVVDENDLCFLGDIPAGMTGLFGLRSEELVPLNEGEVNHFTWQGVRYDMTGLCERVIMNGALAMAEYEDDFYAGEPALTCHCCRKGKAYYLTGGSTHEFYSEFYKRLVVESKIERAMETDLPHGVIAGVRKSDKDYVLLQNYTEEAVVVDLRKASVNILTNEMLIDHIILQPFEAIIIV